MAGLPFVLLGLVFAGSSGCALMGPINSANRYAKSFFTFRGTDYADPTEEEDDPWITEAADEGRAGRPQERDPDQWYRNFFMSEKARSIERNLGFD